MGEIVGEPFEDYGNTSEFSASEIRAYERLSGDRVRFYITEERGDRHILQYTVVTPASALSGFLRKCCEVAEGKYVLPDWALDQRISRGH